MIEFDAATHVYRVNGVVVPSVTQILAVLSDGAKQFYTKESRDRGRAVHAAIDLLHDGDLDESSIDARVLPYLEAYRCFLLDSGYLSVGRECVAHSDIHGYCGTLDALGSFVSGYALLDIKTGSIPATVGAQTAAYWTAWNESRGVPMIDRYCLNLTKTGYKLVKLKREDFNRDFAVFLNALKLWKEQNP